MDGVGTVTSGRYGHGETDSFTGTCTEYWKAVPMATRRRKSTSPSEILLTLILSCIRS